jgi:hypothetical protein
MWQCFETPQSICSQFAAFVGSPCATEAFINAYALDDDDSPALVDLVVYWLDYKATILSMSSYDKFMAGLLLIINAWIQGDRKYIEGRPLWPHLVTGEAMEVPCLIRDESDNEYHDRDEGPRHPILRRDAWDSLRSDWQQAQQRRIEEKLDRLLAVEPHL